MFKHVIQRVFSGQLRHVRNIRHDACIGQILDGLFAVFGESPVFFFAKSPFGIDQAGHQTRRNGGCAVFIIQQMNQGDESDALAGPKIGIFLAVDQSPASFNGMDDNGFVGIGHQSSDFLRRFCQCKFVRMVADKIIYIINLFDNDPARFFLGSDPFLAQCPVDDDPGPLIVLQEVGMVHIGKSVFVATFRRVIVGKIG